MLCAVFIPVAFVSGLTGQFYRQFALTIAISTVISAFNSLTLSPALAAVLLKPHGAPPDALTRGMDKLFGWFFARFNRAVPPAARRATAAASGRVIGRRGSRSRSTPGCVALTVFGFTRLPAGFVPQQDKLYLVGVRAAARAAIARPHRSVIAQDGRDRPSSRASRRRAVPRPVGQRLRNAPNAGIVFFPLDAFDERNGRAAAAPSPAR